MSTPQVAREGISRHSVDEIGCPYCYDALNVAAGDCLTCDGTGVLPADEVPDSEAGAGFRPALPGEDLLVDPGPDACDRCGDGIGIEECYGCGRLLCERCLGAKFAETEECRQCQEEGEE